MSATGEDSGHAWDALARAAADRDAQSEELLRRELLSCELAGAAYAVPVERVREIVRLRPITPMPRVPRWLLGVISLRGEVVQVVDLRMRLGVERTGPTRYTRIVVLHGDDDRVVGVLVDRVREVLRVTEDDIRPASGESAGVSELCVHGEEFVSILDLEQVLSSDAE